MKSLGVMDVVLVNLERNTSNQRGITIDNRRNVFGRVMSTYVLDELTRETYAAFLVVLDEVTVLKCNANGGV